MNRIAVSVVAFALVLLTLSCPLEANDALALDRFAQQAQLLLESPHPEAQESLEQLSYGLARYLTGRFDRGSWACDETRRGEALLGASSESAMRARLDLLVRDRLAPLWAAMERRELSKSIRGETPLPESSRSETCARLVALDAALQCPAAGGSDCQASWFQPVPKDGKVTLVVSTPLISVKAATLSWAHGLVNSLAQDPSWRELIFALQGCETLRGCQELEELSKKLENEAHSTLRRQAYHVLYRRWNELAPSLRQWVTADLEPNLLTAAQEASKTLLSAAQATEETAREAAARSALSLVEAEETLASFIDAALQQVTEAQQRLGKPIEQAQAAANTAVTALADGIPRCDEADSAEAQEPSVVLLQKPSANSPGFRLLTVPTHRPAPAPFAGQSLYEVRLELLIAPGESTFSGDFELPETWDCPASSPQVMRSFDMGLRILDVVKTQQGWRILGGEQTGLNNVVSDLKQFTKSLTALGVAGDWLDSDVEWEVGPDFRDLSFRLPGLDGGQSFQLIADGAWALDAGEFAQTWCQALLNEWLPRKIEGWSRQIRLPIQGWRLELSGMPLERGDFGPTCHTRKLDSEGKPEAAGSGDSVAKVFAVTQEAKLVGEWQQQSFEWTGIAALEVGPAKTALKSWRFSHPPPQILDQALRSAFEQMRQELALSVEGLKVELTAGTPVLSRGFESFGVPFSLRVSRDDCHLDPLTGHWDLPGGQISWPGVDLGETLRRVVSCEGGRVLQAAVAKAIQCEDAALNVFGVPADITVRDKSSAGCRVDLTARLGSESVFLRRVFLHQRKDGFLPDFSNVELSATFTERLATYLEHQLGALESIATARVDNVRFDTSTLTMRLTLLDVPLLGRVELGSLTIGVDGGVGWRSDLVSLLEQRIGPIVAKELNAVVVQVVPSESPVDISVYWDINGLRARAEGKIAVYKDIEAPFEVRLWPEGELTPRVDMKQLKGELAAQLTGVVENAVPIKIPPVKIDPPEPEIHPDGSISIRTGVEISLDSLGSIKVKPIVISKEGVDFGGRFVIEIDSPIPIVPAPPLPIWLTRPGIAYDFESETLSALGRLTIVAPHIDRLGHVQATLTALNEEPYRFLTALQLRGDLVLMNTLSLVTAEGLVALDPAKVEFSVRTSPALKSILEASAHGKMTGNPAAFSLEARLKVLGIQLAEAGLIGNLEQCPKRCLTVHAAVNFLLGTAQGSVSTDPFFIDPLVKLGFALEIFGKRFGGAKIEAELRRARLDADILGLIHLTVVVPGLDLLTPGYLADVIAALFSIRLEDLLNLDPTRIVIAPAGGGSGDASSQAKGKSTQESDPDGPEEPTHNSDPPSLPPGDPPPESRGLPPQIPPAGRDFAACRESDRSYGSLRWYGDQRWYYWSTVRQLTREQWNTVCTGRRPFPRVKGVFTITPTYSLVASDSWLHRQGGSWYFAGSPGPTPTFSVQQMRPIAGKPRYSRIALYYRFFRPHGGEPRTETVEIQVSERYKLDAWKGRRASGIQDSLETYVRSRFRDGTILSLGELELLGTGRTSDNAPRIRARVTYQPRTRFRRVWETVSVWTHVDGNRALLLRSCSAGNSDCKTMTESSEILSALSNLDAIPPGRSLVLDTPATAWLVNEAIPAILEGRAVPRLGEELSVDYRPEGCRLQRLQRLIAKGQTRFRTSTELALSSVDNPEATVTVRREESLLVPASHPLASKTAEAIGEGSRAEELADWIVCQRAPDIWLNDTEVWASSAETLSVARHAAGTNTHLEVIFFLEGRVGQPALLPRYSPYTSEPRLLSADARKRLLSRLEGPLRDQAELEQVWLSVNPGDNVEYLLARTPSHWIVEVRGADSTGRSVLGPATLTATLNRQAVERCLEQLGAPSLPQWTADATAALDVGVSPAFVLRTLMEKPDAACN
ncbi:MAG: hypothetical protein AAF560_01160 [Acidobacteriota bacterium]